MFITAICTSAIVKRSLSFVLLWLWDGCEDYSKSVIEISLACRDHELVAHTSMKGIATVRLISNSSFLIKNSSFTWKSHRFTCWFFIYSNNVTKWDSSRPPFLCLVRPRPQMNRPLMVSIQNTRSTGSLVCADCACVFHPWLFVWGRGLRRRVECPTWRLNFSSHKVFSFEVLIILKYSQREMSPPLTASMALTCTFSSQRSKSDIFFVRRQA